MKALVLILAVMLGFGSLACDLDPLHSTESVSINTNSEPDWVIERGMAAAEVWEAHGFAFAFDEVGTIILHSTDEHPSQPGGGDLLSAFSGRDGLRRIYIAKDTSPYNGNCFTARALGLALGLNYIDYREPSLMDPSYRINADEECPWSRGDEEALMWSTDEILEAR